MKAIQTRYKGYRFRSRLEARWAVFFDALSLKWEYEPEGFETRAGWYLPDFYLPEMDIWAEVKPDQSSRKMDEDDKDKILFFVFESRSNLIILDGPPSKKVYSVVRPCLLCASDCDSDWDPFNQRVCATCLSSGKALPTTAMGTACWHPKYLPCRLFDEPGGGEENSTPIHAINAARGARFEHGEVAQ